MKPPKRKVYLNECKKAYELKELGYTLREMEALPQYRGKISASGLNARIRQWRRQLKSL